MRGGKVQDLEPKLVKDGESKVYEHPAFGQIVVMRMQGNGQVLYGSDFQHQNTISIEIMHSELHRSLSNDRPFSRDPIVRLSLSEAQWASCVSSVGQGEGVQCTLTRVGGTSVPPIAFRDRSEDFKSEVRATTAAAEGEIDALLAEIDLEGGEFSKVSQKARTALRDRLRAAKRKLSGSVGFIAEQFEEHMEGVKEAARAEVHGYVNRVVANAGLAAVSDARGHAPFALLAAPDEGGRDD